MRIMSLAPCEKADSPRAGEGERVGGDIDGMHLAHPLCADPEVAGVEAGAQHHNARAVV